MHIAGQQHLGQLVADGLLHQAAQRPGPVERVEATLGQPLLRRQRHLQRQPALSEPLVQLGQLDVDDRHQLLGIERVEHDHVVEPVDELGFERRPYRRHHLLLGAAGTQVGGQDQDRVAEVDRAALAVGQPALVEHLQQHVEHVGVGLFDLVEQDHRVRAPAHRFGQLTTLVVADVPRRGADQARHRVLLAVLAHVDAHHRALVIEQELRQRLRQLGLADTGRAQEHERARGPVRVGDTGATAANRVGHRGDGLLLPDDATTQLLLHAQQLGRLTLEHPARRDSGPRRHHLGDVVGTDLLLEHHVLAGLGLRDRGVELLLDLGDAPVPQLGGLGQVTVAFGAVGGPLQVLQLLLELAHHIDGALLVLPTGGQLGELLLVVRQLGPQLIQAFLGGDVLLLGQRHLLDLEAPHQAFHLIDLDGAGVDLHPQPRGRLVDEVDGLVGQEPRRDVPVGQRRRGHQRRVGDAHTVVHLVALLEATQDADGVLGRRLAHQHLLEAAFQRGVLLDVLAVLVERGRPDQPQLTAGQHRLDHVAGVHRRLAGGAGADDGVQLVDERDDLPRGVLDLVEDGLEAFLELTAVLGAGHHRAQVERDDGLVAQALGHVTGHDALRQALDDGGLAHAGLADENRVVLGAPGEHLHDAPDLVVTADHRVELAFPGPSGQVGGVLLQRLIAALGVRAGHPRAAAHLLERFAQRLRGCAVAGQKLGDVGVVTGQADQQVLGGDVFVVQFGGQLLGHGDGGDRLPAQLRGRAGTTGRGQPADQAFRFGADRRRINSDRLQQRAGDAVVLGEQRHQQVRGHDLWVARGGGRLHRRGQCRLGLRGRVERVHDTSIHRWEKCLSSRPTQSRLSLFRSTLENFRQFCTPNTAPGRRS